MTKAQRRAARLERRNLRNLLTWAPDRWADVPAYSVIVPGLLWQGKPPTDREQLEGLGIKTLVTCCLGLEPGGSYLAPDGIELVRFPIDDGDEIPGAMELAAVVELVCDRVAAGVPTYVHCTQGLNRSGLVVALALRALTGLSGERVIAALRQLRHRDVLCNTAFAAFVAAVTLEPMEAAA